VKQTARAEAEWMTVAALELLIVSDELWAAVHERLGEARESYLRGTQGKIWGIPEPARSPSIC
jgi:hypothetical protein